MFKIYMIIFCPLAVVALVMFTCIVILPYIEDKKFEEHFGIERPYKMYKKIGKSKVLVPSEPISKTQKLKLPSGNEIIYTDENE